MQFRNSGFALSRRFLLQGMAATALTIPPRISFALEQPMRLRAASGAKTRLMDDNPALTPVWSYNETVPGPVLRTRRGGTVDIAFENALDQSSSIHWHGIRIDNAMDGVPGLTQDPVEPGGSFHYRFKAPDAGTFWYHPHLSSAEQVDRGLYGLLIVDEDEPPVVDQDVPLVLDDWRLADDGSLIEDFANPHDAAHAGRLGNIATLGGKPYLTLETQQNQRIRLRFCCTANARVSALSIDDHDLLIIAVDGQPVAPFAAPNGEILLAPGQRVDVIVDATRNTGNISKIRLITQGERLEIGELRYGSAPSRPAPLPAFQPLAPNLESVAIETAAATQVELLMQGGAMGRLPDGLAVGDTHEHGHPQASADGRPLVAWAFNGVAGMPEKPLFAARRNEHIVMNLRNDTLWPHAIHLHGHHFREVAADGKVFAIWRDTILLEANETRRIAMVCDNPGKWMLHCHMLEHQASGMMSWFTVS